MPVECIRQIIALASIAQLERLSLHFFTIIVAILVAVKIIFHVSTSLGHVPAIDRVLPTSCSTACQTDTRGAHTRMNIIDQVGTVARGNVPNRCCRRFAVAGCDRELDE